MSLLGKKLLMLVTDGVSQTEMRELKEGFERERAIVLLTTPKSEASEVTALTAENREESIPIDLPWEAVDETAFDGLILPDSALSPDLFSCQEEVLNLIFMFYQLHLPIFASGKSVDLLYQSEVLSRQVLVREEGPLHPFLTQAIQLLMECSPLSQTYRLTKE